MRVVDGGCEEGLQTTTGQGEEPSRAMCQLILVFRFRILNFFSRNNIFLTSQREYLRVRLRRDKKTRTGYVVRILLAMMV